MSECELGRVSLACTRWGVGILGFPFFPELRLCDVLRLATMDFPHVEPIGIEDGMRTPCNSLDPHCTRLSGLWVALRAVQLTSVQQKSDEHSRTCFWYPELQLPPLGSVWEGARFLGAMVTSVDVH